MAIFKAHDYQRRAIEWVMDHERCTLFLDMGLGKSVITLSAVVRLIDSCEVSRVLVVAPKKVAESTWTSEADKWAHLSCLKVSRVMGTEAKRRTALDTPADVYVIGRDNFVWLVGEYNGKLPFDMLVIDELTSFKSPTSRRFKALRAVRHCFSRIVGLTGTPAPNGLLDLWAQLYCIDGGERLGKFITHYRDRYFDCHRWNNIIVRCTPRKGAEETIRGLISDICLSMQASDYLTLPPMNVIDVDVPLPPKVMKQYLDMERENVLELANNPTPILADSAAALMNKLSQMADGVIYDENHNAIDIHREKLARLLELVEGANAQGSGVLVFYQYRSDIPRLMETLHSYRTAVYEGDEQLKAWNAGDLDVLLAHPASTAYGLNMQHGGRYIVWLGTGWDLELYQQANARLHRQGQRYPVTVYRLAAAGTVDYQAIKALDGKCRLQQALLDGLNYLKSKYNVEG